MAVDDGEPSTLVGVYRLAMVGEGAGESIDPKSRCPHGRRQLTRFDPSNAHA
jgi:hypothetical protein